MKIHRIAGIILSISGLTLAVFCWILFPGSINTDLLKPLSLLTIILGFTATSLSFSGQGENPEKETTRIYIPFWIMLIILVSINAVMLFLNQTDFFVYYILDSIIYVLFTLFLNSLKYKPVYTLNVISTVLFAGFFGVLAEKIYNIVS